MLLKECVTFLTWFRAPLNTCSNSGAKKNEYSRCGESVVEIGRVIKILSPLHQDAHRPDKWADAKGTASRGRDSRSAHTQNAQGRSNLSVSATPPEYIHTPHGDRRELGLPADRQSKNSGQTT